MDDVPPVVSTVPSQHLEGSSRPSAGSGERRTHERQRQKKQHLPGWWRRRNVLGVLNWELALIVVGALMAGALATIGSSVVGVR